MVFDEKAKIIHGKKETFLTNVSNLSEYWHLEELNGYRYKIF